MRGRRGRNQKRECNSQFCIPYAKLVIFSNVVFRLLLRNVASLKVDKVLIICNIYLVDLTINGETYKFDAE